MTDRNLVGVVHPYWFKFYINRFANGYTRRALIGSILDAVLHRHLTVKAVNLIALAVAVTLTGLLLRSLYRWRDSCNLTKRTAQVVLLAGTVISLEWEVLGDLLQITIGACDR